MQHDILDNIVQIKGLDHQNMVGSLELLGRQVEEVWSASRKITIPASYRGIKNIVVAGMGGSTLGSHIIKSLYQQELKLPLDVVNGYTVPAYINNKSLVIASSYSGTTEETLAAAEDAYRKKAKVAVISSGGALAEWAKKRKLPALIFSTESNPCGQPRMGLGYMVIGQIILIGKIGLLNLSESRVRQVVKVINSYSKIFGIDTPADKNLAKQMAMETKERSVWYVASEHLAGNIHAAANQTNENAKRFAGFFAIPELNHHLMEGIKFPKSIKQNSLFILIESNFYDARVRKRYEITERVLQSNGINYLNYKCQEKQKLLQTVEVLVLSSYISYYSAMLEHIDPSPIPFVDYFKKELKK